VIVDHRPLLLVIALSLAVASCESRACTPGVTQSCVCAGDVKGAQICDPEGAGWGACDCGTITPPEFNGDDSQVPVVGEWQPKTDADCRASLWCTSYGRCYLSGDRCIAKKDADCAESLWCGQYGHCAVSGDRCVATKDAHCAASNACAGIDGCIALQGWCWFPAKTSKDCKTLGACSYLGHCAVGGSRCIANDEIDCKDSKWCKSIALCTLQDKRCTVGSSVDCNGSDKCDKHGLCTFRHGVCVAATDQDCQSMTLCAKYGLKCKAWAGRCVAEVPGDESSP